MQSILKASRFLLPVAFLGYATVVNLGYARFPDRADLGDNLLSGGPTAKVESLYRQSLPHRESAIGAMGALRLDRVPADAVRFSGGDGVLRAHIRFLSDGLASNAEAEVTGILYANGMTFQE